MNTYLLPAWITDRLLNAVCWTLFHSLWIGLIVAVLAAIVIAYTRKSAPAQRYQLFCILLVLFVAATAYAYYCELRETHTDTLAIAYSHLEEIHLSIKTPGNYNMLDGVTAVFNRWSDLIFFAWLTCFIIQLARLFGGLLYGRHLFEQVSKPGEYWQDLTDKFCHALEIQKKVTLVLSKRVHIPVVIGFLKPVILLPAGILLQLPPEQVEAVIWHELGHVRRHDYLVNILQRIIESFFFFNPALLWLSTLIREEREACCDDVVLAHINKKSNYLEALLAFKQQHDGLHMAMHLKKNKLMERLRRMVHKENKRLDWIEKTVLISSVLVFCSFTFLRDNSSDFKKSITGAEQTIASFVKPVEQPHVTSIDTLYHVAKLQFRHALADRLNCEMDITDSRGDRYCIKLVNGKAITLMINDPAIPGQELGRHQALVAKIVAEVDRVIENKQVNMRSRQRAQKPIVAKKSKHPDRTTKHGTGKKARRHKTGENESMPRGSESNAFDKANDVIVALMEANAISNTTDIKWYVLNHEQLVVNDKKLPGDLHQKLVKQFDIETNFGIYYGATKIYGKGLIIEPGDIRRDSRKLF